MKRPLQFLSALRLPKHVPVGVGISVILGACALKTPSLDSDSGAEAGRFALEAEASDIEKSDGSEEVVEASVEVAEGDFESAANTSYDESTAVREALVQGLDTALAELALNGTEFESELVRSAMLPHLVGVVDAGQNGESLPANANRIEDRDLGAGVFLRQDLLTWGANRKRLQAAGLKTESQTALVEMQKLDTAAAVHVGYATLRRIAATKKAYRGSITSYREFLKAATERSEAGVDSGRSVQEIESRIAELDATVSMLEVEEETTKQILDRLTGSDGKVKYVLYPEVIHSVSVLGAEQVDVSRRPDIAALGSELRAAELELGATKAERWPRLTVSGGVRSESDLEFGNQRSEALASAGSRWVPMEGGAHQARAKLAQNKIDAVRLQMQSASKLAESEVRNGYAAIGRARAALAASERAVAAAKKSLEMTEAQQETQRSEIDHVLNAQNRVLRATLQRVEIDFALKREQVLLKRALGDMGNPGVTLSRK